MNCRNAGMRVEVTANGRLILSVFNLRGMTYMSHIATEVDYTTPFLTQELIRDEIPERDVTYHLT